MAVSLQCRACDDREGDANHVMVQVDLSLDTMGQLALLGSSTEARTLVQ